MLLPRCFLALLARLCARSSSQRAMLKLLPAFLCFDVYIHWMRLGRFYSGAASSLDAVSASALEADSFAASEASAPFLRPQDRHATIITLQACAMAVYWITILFAAGIITRWNARTTHADADAATKKLDAPTPPAGADSSVASSPTTASPSSPVLVHSSTPLLIALMLSSFGKFFSLLPLIWSAEYAQIDTVARGLKLFVIASNIKAIQGECNGEGAPSRFAAGGALVASITPEVELARRPQCDSRLIPCSLACCT
jgi:hypothetical protein